MDKQFFICHSTSDTSLAEALVEELEADGYKCWLSSRDAPEGSDSEKPVYSAILESTAVLLVFSENTSQSQHIRGELDIAANQRIPIIPLKFHEAEISKSIRYYTHSRQWIDCTALQANTPEIGKTVFGLAKKPMQEDQHNSGNGKKRLWVMISAILLAVILFSVFLKGTASIPDLDSLINVAAGGRDSWDYASDVVYEEDGSIIVAGAWDRGYWSEIWIARFDNSQRQIYNWSDTISGTCQPLILPTAGGGCITVYTNFEDSSTDGFAYIAIRLDPMGNIIWETRTEIEHHGDWQPVTSSLNWLPDSTVVASFTLLSSSANRHTSCFALIDGSDGAGETFTLPGSIETQCVAISSSGDILHVGTSTTEGTNSMRTLDTDGQQDFITTSDLMVYISCVEYNPDNSIIAAGTSGGETGVISVTKFSKDFEIIWESNFDNSIYGIVTDLSVLPDGSIVLVGSTAPNGETGKDGRVLYLNRSGKLVWESILDTGGDDHLLSVDRKEDGSLLLSGSTTCFGDRDAWLVEMTAGGEHNNSCIQGIEFFTEDWETGFIGQEFWILTSGEDDPSSVVPNGTTGDLSLTINNAPVILRKPVQLVPGLCFSAEISVPAGTESDSSWVSIGTTDSEHGLSPSLQEGSDSEFRLNYSPEQELVISFGRISPCSVLTIPVQLTAAKPQLFTIENYEDSVFFLINDSLIYTMHSMNEPDSLRFFINGNSTSLQHSVNNIRAYLRKW